MKDAQKQVDEWVRQYKIGYFKPLEIIITNHALLTFESN